MGEGGGGQCALFLTSCLRVWMGVCLCVAYLEPQKSFTGRKYNY